MKIVTNHGHSIQPLLQMHKSNHVCFIKQLQNQTPLRLRLPRSLKIKTRICSRQSNEHSCHDLAAEPFPGEMANSAIRQFVIWPVGLFALCLFSSMTPRCQILLPSGLWWPLGDWLAVGVGTKKVHAFLNVRYNTHKYRTQWKYYKYTLSGVWLLCQDLLLWWHYTDGFLEPFHRSTVYSVQCTPL